MAIDFVLLLPGESVNVSGANNPAKFHVRNTSGASLAITTLTCPGGTVGRDSNDTVGTIGLADGASCELFVFWENGDSDKDISFSGAILERRGEVYSLTTTATIAGEDFGGLATQPSDPEVAVERSGRRFTDGDTDGQGDQTVGAQVPLTYVVSNEGGAPLRITDVKIVNASSNVDVSIVPPGLNNAFILNGDSESFEVEYNVRQSGDFRFEIEISHNGDPTDDIFTIIVDGSTPSEGDSGKARTKRIISNFMARRGAQIVSKEPDLTKRLATVGGSSNGPANVTGEGTASNNNLAFATSLRQVVRSGQLAKRKRIGDGAQMMTLGAAKDGATDGGSLKDDGAIAPKSRNGFGLWAEGTWARIEDGTAESDFGLLYVGADYRFNAGLVVGLIAQFDKTDEKDITNDFSIDGRGWLVGPYIVARLSRNLILDGRAAWGRSDNEVSPFNTYTDEFEGKRWLLRGRLTGNFKFSSIHVAPHIGVVYFKEEQQAYTDNVGNEIEAQTVALGRLTFGPKFSTSIERPDGTVITPHVAIQGIWDFKHTDQVDIDTGLAVTGADDFRARAEAGLSVRLPVGVSITGEGFYDGIGANGYDAYGGSLKVGVPF